LRRPTTIQVTALQDIRDRRLQVHG
jgi:hypothetical protein